MGRIKNVLDFSSSMLTTSVKAPSETTVTLFNGPVWGHTGRCWRTWLRWRSMVLTCQWHRGGLWRRADSPLVAGAGGGSRVGQWMDWTVMDDAETLSGIDLSQWTALQAIRRNAPWRHVNTAHQYCCQRLPVDHCLCYCTWVCVESHQLRFICQ